MSHVDLAIIEKLNGLVARRFSDEIKLNATNAAFKAKQAAAAARHQVATTRIQARISKSDAQIASLVTQHRDMLIGPKRKSFATTIAKFQFRSKSAKPKAVDTNGLMAVARRLGVVRKIADPNYAWKFNSQKFFAWLNIHHEYRPYFEEFIDEPEQGESLSITPNGTYTVVHDNQRISPPSITIAKS